MEPLSLTQILREKSALVQLHEPQLSHHVKSNPGFQCI